MWRNGLMFEDKKAHMTRCVLCHSQMRWYWQATVIVWIERWDMCYWQQFTLISNWSLLSFVEIQNNKQMYCERDKVICLCIVSNLKKLVIRNITFDDLTSKE